MLLFWLVVDEVVKSNVPPRSVGSSGGKTRQRLAERMEVLGQQRLQFGWACLGPKGFAHFPSLYGGRKESRARAKRGEVISSELFCLVGWKEVRTPTEQVGAAGAGTHVAKQEKIKNKGGKSGFPDERKTREIRREKKQYFKNQAATTKGG